MSSVRETIAGGRSFQLDTPQSSASKRDKKEKKEQHAVPDGDQKSSAEKNSDADKDGLPVVLASPAPEALICPLHKELMETPVIARCGHTFCKSCIEKHLTMDPRCPVDSVALQPSPEFLFPNLAVSDQLRNLLIRCKFGLKKSKKKSWEVDIDGCPELIKLGQREQHEATCPHAVLSCTFCNSLPMKRYLFEEHRKLCAKLPCPHHSAGCAFSGKSLELQSHLQECPYEAIRGFITQNQSAISDLRQQSAATHADARDLNTKVDALARRLEQLCEKLEETHAHYEHDLKTLRFTVEEQAHLITVMRNELVGARRALALAPDIPNAVSPTPKIEILPGMDATQFKCIGTFSGHTGPVWCLAVSSELQVLASGSSDTTIKVWDIATYKVKRTLHGHEGIVHAVTCLGRLIISGSSDKTIRVWSLDKPKAAECLRTLAGHDNTVCSLHTAAGSLFSGSYGNVKVHSLDTWNLTHTLQAHNHWVRAITSTSRHLYTGSYNAIKVWDLKSLECVKNITAHHGSIYSMLPYNQWLICGTYENAVVIWNLDSLEMLHILNGHTGAVYALCISGSYCFSGSYDTSIRVWNLDTLKCTQTLVRHNTTVDALTAHSGSVFSGSADHSIKVWK